MTSRSFKWREKTRRTRKLRHAAEKEELARLANVERRKAIEEERARESEQE